MVAARSPRATQIRKERAPGAAPTFGGYVASSARILASPTFWCFGPAVAIISTVDPIMGEVDR